MTYLARFAVVSVLLATLLTPGCVPSDYEIQEALNESRREAYNEWKANRARGGTAEARVTGPLSLDEAVRLALQYNKPLQRMVEERQVTRGERMSAYSIVTPSMSATFSGNRYENHRMNGSSLFRYSNGISIDQNIVQGERIPAALRQARLTTALTDERVRDEVQNLIAYVARSYYDVLLAQKMVEVNEEALISARAQYRMTSEKKKQETATEYDVLRAQVDVANYQARVQSEKNNIDTNRVTMLKYMGVSQDSDISFSDTLEFLPMRPVIERAVELAFGLRPDIRQAELSARSSIEARKIAESDFWPMVAATFNQSWTDSSSGSGSGSGVYRRNPWYAGLSATYQLGVDTFGDLVAAKARVKQAQIDILDNQEKAIMEIRMEINNLANAEETIKYLEVNQDAARESLRLVEVGYQAGVRTEVDVTDARKALTEVIGQYYTALADHTKARLNLQLAMGVLGPCRVTEGTQLPPAVPIANLQEFAATDYEPAVTPVMPIGYDNSAVGPMSLAAPAPQAVSSEPVASAAPVRTETQAAASMDKYEPLPEPVAIAAPIPAAPQAPVAPAASRGQVGAGTIPASLPAAAQAPVVQEAKPLFKVKVREGSTASAGETPEVAQLGW